MALLSLFPLTSSSFHQVKCASAPIPSSAASPMRKFHVKPKVGNMGSSNAVRASYLHTINSRSSVIVKASVDIDGTGAVSGDAAAGGEKAAVSVENLPLESKLQEKMDQKLRMKLAKKIRLRRKRLVRKRHLRKKGRWPPSKMKKLKNV